MKNYSVMVLSWLGAFFDHYPFTFSQRFDENGNKITRIDFEYPVFFDELKKALETKKYSDNLPDECFETKINDYLIEIVEMAVIFKGWFDDDLGEVESRKV